MPPSSHHERETKDMAKIDTPKDWWEAVEAGWERITDIFANCGAPLNDTFWSDGIGQEPVFHDETLVQMLRRLREDRDHAALSRWFNLCWLAAPDSAEIHRWPYWGTFCDLCSETWVFDPEQAEA